jgi:Trypsin-like peptidase domain/Colicin V production protein
MTWLDVALIALLLGSAFAGYRRGALLQMAGIAGLVAGTLVGVVLAPRVAQLAGTPEGAVGVVLATVLVAGAVGNVIGYAAGNRARLHAHGSSLRRVDAVGGAIVSGIGLLLATWFVALNLASGPFPTVARTLRSSGIVRTLDERLPPPPSLLGEAERLLALLGFPDVFSGLPVEPAPPVDPPTQAQAAAATRAAESSTVEVFGSGCNQGFLNQGSGFVVADDLVVTNAHVVAGTSAQWVQFEGGKHEATVVAFDPSLDVAVLRVRGLGLAPLPLLHGEAERGDVGAVLGYPGGGALDADAAAVRRVMEPVGRDIYGDDEVRRRVYELQATIQRGNSGGPFVLASGRAAGLVFASSVQEQGVGYAIVSGALTPIVERARALTAGVESGSCAG